MDQRLFIVKGDITTFEVDAIVNAANNALLGGGGVDGAIHAAAGPELDEECRKIGFCPTGGSVLTSGFNLPAKYIIHTVGPVYDSAYEDEKAAMLRSCYISSLKKAAKHNLRTVAFPSISTGIYRFPIDQAAPIALKAINDFLNANKDIDKVYMVCYDDYTLNKYLNASKEL